MKLAPETLYTAGAFGFSGVRVKASFFRSADEPIFGMYGPWRANGPVSSTPSPTPLATLSISLFCQVSQRRVRLALRERRGFLGAHGFSTRSRISASGGTCAGIISITRKT